MIRFIFLRPRKIIGFTPSHHRVVLVLLLLFLPTLLSASSRTQAPLIPTEQFRRFQRITVNDGLSQGSAVFVHQDKTGFIWFGTAGGFDRYDGIEFKRYDNIPGLPKKPVYFYSIVENADSAFWLSTDVGLVLFNPVTDSGRLFTPPPDIFRSQSAVGLYLTKLNDESLMFAVTGVGLVRFDPRSETFEIVYAVANSKPALLQDEIVGILSLESGRVLVACYDRLLMYNPQERTISHIAMFPPDMRALCLMNDRATNSALVGTSRGLMMYKQNTLKPLYLPTSQVQPENTDVRALFRDSRGTLWVGFADGLAAFDQTNNRLTMYRHDPSDASSILPGAVLAMHEDRSANLWITFFDHGVCRVDLKKRQFHTISNRPLSPRQLASGAVWGIAVDRRQDVWFSGGGLSSVDSAKTRVTLHKPVAGTSSTRYADNTRRVYALNDSLMCLIANRVVYLYNTKRHVANELIADGAPVKDVYRLLIKTSGALVCVSSDSIFEIDPLRNKLIRTLLVFREGTALPPSVSISAMLEDETGNVWLGTTIGLAYIDMKRTTVELMNNSPESRVQIPQLPILSLAWENGETFWIGSQSGLYVYDVKTRDLRLFGTRDGLPNEKIWSIQLDRQNIAWLGTNRGLVRTELSSDWGMHFRTYTIDDGLLSNEFGMGTNAIDSSGTVYMGGIGIVYFTPDSLKDNPYTPAIALTGLSIYGVPVSTEKEIAFMQHLSIPYENKVWSVRFAALEYTDARRNRYAYKLDGHDEQWVEAGTRREAFYTNLDPGTYTLLIKASNNDNVWTEKPLAVEITIIPPFWMTWWFRGIAALVLLGTIGAAIRYFEVRKVSQRLARLEQERALEHERTRISRDMHDELGANLTSLSMITEIARRSLGEPAHAEAQLRKASDIASETVRKLDEIVWAVNPKADRLDNLVAYISEYAQEFFGTTRIRVRFDFPVQIPDIALASDVRHNIFLVVKESLTNIVKHSRATEASICMVLKDDTFLIEVRDNGVGFSVPMEAHLGNGIRNMQQRVISIGAALTIQRGDEGGTALRIEVPFPSNFTKRV